MNYQQILDTISLGVVVLNRDFRIVYWNRWMAMHSNITTQTILNQCLFDFYPRLNNPVFLRSCKSVLTFGNLIFLSQKLHQYLFPFKLIQAGGSKSGYMQQSCTMGPLRNADNVVDHIFITIQDVTEIVSYAEKLKQLNMTDGLTGIYNRRYLDLRIGEEFKRHKRFHRPLSLILMDIDHFKSVNDTYGHQFGDQVLQSVAEIIASAIRNVDIAARYGGEEFCCILPETRLQEGMLIAERIREKMMAAEHQCLEQPLQITISLGISCLNDAINSPEELMEKADKALYQAKNTGRNKAVASHHRSETASGTELSTDVGDQKSP